MVVGRNSEETDACYAAGSRAHGDLMSQSGTAQRGSDPRDSERARLIKN
jgi:hypothetical protein